MSALDNPVLRRKAENLRSRSAESAERFGRALFEIETARAPGDAPGEDVSSFLAHFDRAAISGHA